MSNFMKWITVRMQWSHIPFHSGTAQMFIFKRIHYKIATIVYFTSHGLAARFELFDFTVGVFFANHVCCKHVETCKVWHSDRLRWKKSQRLYNTYEHTTVINGKDKAKTGEQWNSKRSNMSQTESKSKFRQSADFFAIGNANMSVYTVLFKVCASYFVLHVEQ